MRRTVLRVVAAAGAGTRMGQTKALLDLNGKSSLERISELSLPGFDLETVVVVGHDAERVQHAAERLGCAVIRNRDWERGQTSSIRTALDSRAAGSADRILLHPVDLPLVAQATYEALAAKMKELDDGQVVATSIDGRRGHPLVFGATLRQLILDMDDSGSIRRVLQDSGLPVEHVVVPDPWIRKDLDHPADLEEARRFLQERG